MAARLETADVTCPGSTPVAAPVEVPFTFPTGILRRVTIWIPDGHAGLTGISLGYGHTPVMPRSNGAFLTGNDEVMRFDITDDVPGVPWSAFLCNLDIQQHSWQVRLEYDEVADAPTPAPVTPIPQTDLEAATEALLSSP